MRPISEIFEDMRRYLKERGQIHDNDFWERQAHFEHLERLINAELDIKTIVGWLGNGMSKFKGAIPYISSQRYHDYLKELHDSLNGHDPAVALFLKHLSSNQVSLALKASIKSESKFVEELLVTTLNDNETLQKIFMEAIQQKNIPLIKLFLQYRVDVTENIYLIAKKTDDEQIYQLIVQPYHTHKKQLLNEGPVLPLSANAQTPPTIEQALLSRTFVEKAVMKSTLRKGISDIAQKRLLKDVLAVAALAALGKHEQGLTRAKQLAIVIAEDLKTFVAFNRGAMGIYNTKNSLYVSSQHDKAVLPILAHEATHFVANEVFKNDSNPYSTNDVHNQRLFSEIVNESKAILTKLPKDNIEMQLAATAFEEVYEEYSEKKQALELIARIPQIIVLLGNDEGENWLKTYFPKLLDYYECVFVPACKQYLADHHAEQHLHFSDTQNPMSNKKK